MNIKHGLTFSGINLFPLNTHNEVTQAIKFFGHAIDYKSWNLIELTRRIDRIAEQLQYPKDVDVLEFNPILRYQHNLRYLNCNVKSASIMYTIHPLYDIYDDVFHLVPLQNKPSDSIKLTYWDSIYEVFSRILFTYAHKGLECSMPYFYNIIEDVISYILYTYKYSEIDIDKKYEPLIRIANTFDIIPDITCLRMELESQSFRGPERILPCNKNMIDDIIEGRYGPLNKFTANKYIEECNDKGIS